MLKDDQTEVELTETLDYGDENVKAVIEGDNADVNEDLEAQGYSGVDENDELTSLSDNDYALEDVGIDDAYDDVDEY